MSFDDQDLIRMNRVLRHRLRNMASGIQNAVSLLAKELDPRLTPSEREYFPLLLNECLELRKVTDRLNMLFDEVPSGGPGPLGDVLDQLAQRMRTDYPTTPVAVECDEPLRRTPVSARQWLLMALDELVVNAMQSKPGSEVRVRAERPAGDLVLQVTDLGRGMVADARAALFQPFFTTRPRHLGVGLAIARRWAIRAGGDIRPPDPVPEVGWRMDLVLPRFDVQAGA